MKPSLKDFKNIFFIGIAGSGMSALAWYMKEEGNEISGSDRFFIDGTENEIRNKLEEKGIRCYLQDGSGINTEIQLVVASTAIEESVPEIQKSRQLGIPVIRRSELLAMITNNQKTIAIGGTSGKSTTCAMLYEIMEYAGFDPGIITGAALISLLKKGKIGNAEKGAGEWLVIEADESDGSIVQYKPEIGVLLNVEKDHKETAELMEMFTVFRNNSKKFIVNRAYPQTAVLSADKQNDFSADCQNEAGYKACDYHQNGLAIEFIINDKPFNLQAVGRHNMENALAAVAVAHQMGISLDICSEALKNYQGIYRRHQVYGKKNGIWLIDDFAHNPVKCAASIRACQPIAPKVIAWFQPHGYGPTRFLRNDFVQEISAALRSEDEIWMSEIYYAGGTATKDISASDLINDLKEKGARAYFVENRNDIIKKVRPHLDDNCVLLLMGARDPSLEDFARMIWQQL